jgi:hypothetical protein
VFEEEPSVGMEMIKNRLRPNSRSTILIWI